MLSFIFLIFIASIYLKDKDTVKTFNLSEDSNINTYKMDVIFDDDSKRILCNQTIKYINNTNTDLDKIYMHIYPNAFSKKSFAPFEEDEMKRAYPNGFNEGYIDIKNVLSNSNKLNYKIKGDKKDILEIKLNKELKKGEKIDIDLKYNVKIPNSLGRFGYGENTINITNWFPIACVYDEEGFNKESYDEIGDPFYSDASDFYVKILLPKKYKLSSTGKVVSQKSDSEKTMYEIVAKNVRDFAFVLSDKFIVDKDTYNNIEITTYNLNKDLAKKATEVSKDSLKIFTELFGEYPYDNYDVVASDFFIGGMEYPNLVMIDETLYNEKDKFLMEYVIAHETAHQWWYGVVGNDEVNEPWIDEALTEYSTILYFEKKYGKDMADKLLNNMNMQTKSYSSKNIFKPTKKYKNSMEYSLNVYTKGTLAFNKVREVVGDEKFFNVLRQYYNTYTYQNVNGAEFVKVWNDNGVDIDKIISEFK